jgi:integral membrane protein
VTDHETTGHASAGTQLRSGAQGKALGPALTRYRVMAWVTGSFLLLLCVEMVAKYVFSDGEPWLGTWVAIVHGWIYVAYLLTVVDLWSKLRWTLGRLVVLVLAGVVPLLSFVAEHRTTAEVRALSR